MKHWLLVVALVCFGSTAIAQVTAAAPAPAAPPQYAADSWTYNVDFKDPDNLAAFIGRALHNGQWVGGARWDPASVYHVDDAAGMATRWARAGVMVVTNAERLNATFGPHLGLDVAQWTSRAEIAGPISTAAKLWKPLGFASVTATVDLWGGWMPVHTADVKGNIEGGFGFSIQGKFGGPSAAAGASNAILKGGL
jgi:hypothetical protein